MEIIATRYKDKRDEMFRDYRANGNHLEKQAVKFSDVELEVNLSTGEISLDNKGRPMYHSLWCIAYPSR